jgi:hypothetical protein
MQAKQAKKWKGGSAVMLARLEEDMRSERAHKAQRQSPPARSGDLGGNVPSRRVGLGAQFADEHSIEAAMKASLLEEKGNKRVEAAMKASLLQEKQRKTEQDMEATAIAASLAEETARKVQREQEERELEEVLAASKQCF